MAGSLGRLIGDVIVGTAAIVALVTAGCAGSATRTHPGAAATTGLVLVRPDLAGGGEPGWEQARNDRHLGRIGPPTGGGPRPAATLESRQRLAISNGRPREVSTFTWRTRGRP